MLTKKVINLLMIVLFFYSCKKDDMPDLDPEFIPDFSIPEYLKTNSELKDKLIDLTKKAKANNYESGYLVTMKDDGRAPYYIEITGDTYTPSLSFSLDYPIDGLLHNHYNGLFTIFSSSDIRVLYELCSNDFVNDYKKFHTIVVSAEETAYAITIEDKDQFLDFGDKYLSDISQFRKIEKSYFDLTRAYKKEYDNTYAFELAFFNTFFRQQISNGLNLYTASYPYNQWRSIHMENGQTELTYQNL